MSAFQRSISYSSQRQALTVALLGFGAVIVGTILLLLVTDHGLEKVFFEAISAFGTVRLSTGITSGLPAAAQLVLMVLMFTGRIGTITVASPWQSRPGPGSINCPRNDHHRVNCSIRISAEAVGR